MRNYVLIVLVALFVPSFALAQPAGPSELTKKAPTEDLTSWDIVAGGSSVAGNTKSFGLSAGTQFSLIRSKHRFDAGSMLIFTRARVQDGSMETTARNMNSQARYEYFFRERDAVFMAVRHRWDTFAGLDTRLQLQPGYLRVFHENKERERRFWGEVGYDFTYDNLYPNPLFDPDTGLLLQGYDIVHAGRVFLGWDFKYEDKFRILTGVETLLNVQEIGDLRVNWNTRITTSIGKTVELGVQFLLMYDRIPVPGAKPLDTYLLGNLIVHLL